MNTADHWQLELGYQDQTQLGATASSDRSKPQKPAPRYRVQLHVHDEATVPLSATRATTKQPA